MIGVGSIMAIEKGSVEKLKSGSFRLRVTIGYNEKGNPIRLDKISEAATLRKAYVELDEWIEDLEEHGYEDFSTITFEAFYEDIWKSKIKSQLEPRTYADYRTIIEQRFLPTLKGKTLREIKPYMIREIVENAKMRKNKKKSISRRTKKKHLNAISNLFNFAMTDYRIIDRNPVSEVRLKKVKGEKKKVEAPYNLAEINLLFKKLNEADTELKTKALIYTAFITGARLAEIAALEETDIDYKNSKIHFHQRIVRVGEPKIDDVQWARMDGLKNGEEKTLAVPADYLEIMKEYAKEKQLEREKLKSNPEHKYFFGYPDGSFQIPTSLSRRWSRWAKQVGLRHIRFHDIRHTSASFLVANPEIPIKVIQERLGHTNYQTTMNMYASALEESDRQASDIFNNVIKPKEED